MPLISALLGMKAVTLPFEKIRHTLMSMNILHTADWHLGNTFHGHNRSEEHAHFLSWMLALLKEKQPDALIVSGDIYDTANPSAQAEEMLYNFLLSATLMVPGLQVVLTAGNHDSANRLEAPAALLKTHNIYVRGAVHYAADGSPLFKHFLLPLANRQSGRAACVCMALPFLRASDCPTGLTPEEGLRHYFNGMHRAYEESEFSHLPLIAAAHFYARGAEISETEHSERLVVGGQDCVSAAVVGKGMSYTALGHIHKAQHVGGNINAWYAGSPLPLSFSEKHYNHGVQWISIDDKGKATVERIAYTPLRRLISIPDKGTASVKEVFDAIAHLPKRKDVDTSQWPYLELRIEEQQPEPTLMHDVLEALSDRAVLFCRMLRERPEAETAEQAEALKVSTDTLSRMSPTDMAERVYRSRYNTDMPEPLRTRFYQAVKQSEENATNI